MAQAQYTYNTEKRLYQLYHRIYICPYPDKMRDAEPEVQELQELLSPKLLLLWMSFFRRYSRDPKAELEAGHVPTCKWYCFRAAFRRLASGDSSPKTRRLLRQDRPNSKTDPQWASKVTTLFTKTGASIVDKYPDLGRHVMQTYQLNQALPLQAAVYTVADLNVDPATSSTFYLSPQPHKADGNGSGALGLLAAAAASTSPMSGPDVAEEGLAPRERAPSAGRSSKPTAGCKSMMTAASAATAPSATRRHKIFRGPLCRSGRTIGPADSDVSAARVRAMQRQAHLVRDDEATAFEGASRVLDRIRSCPVLNYFDVIDELGSGEANSAVEAQWD
ncbi:hypothetical protein OC834_004592 [Tilletia horrida]|nr:hypothetical protein OC834_004592 [Tilletia horrida]